MSDPPRDLDARREWIDFSVVDEPGNPIAIRARGVALDGDDLVFFNNWSSGGVPIGTRIQCDRVRSVTTEALPRPMRGE